MGNLPTSAAASARGVEWTALRESALAGYTCLWQDLDGVHIAPAPPDAPRTSILWAWPSAFLVTAVVPHPYGGTVDEQKPRPIWAWEPPARRFDQPLLRVRLDKDMAYVADLTEGRVTPVEAWGNEAQIDGLWVADDTTATLPPDVLRHRAWVEVREELPEEAQPVMFICPAEQVPAGVGSR